MKLRFLLSIFLVLLCQAYAQGERFIAIVIEHAIGSVLPSDDRCPGTVITNKHLLTTAACATPTNSSFQIAVDAWPIYDGGIGWNRHDVDEVIIHPDYTADIFSNNIAVIRWTGEFNVLLPPRTLGSLTTNSTCRLFVRDGRFEDTEIVDVQVYEPQYCDPGSPQAYCSEVSVPSDRVCETYSGSPLVCNAQSVDGIFLQSGCREISPGRYLIVFHSVGQFTTGLRVFLRLNLVHRLTGKFQVSFYYRQLYSV